LLLEVNNKNGTVAQSETLATESTLCSDEGLEAAMIINNLARSTSQTGNLTAEETALLSNARLSLLLKEKLLTYNNPEKRREAVAEAYCKELESVLIVLGQLYAQSVDVLEDALVRKLWDSFIIGALHASEKDVFYKVISDIAKESLPQRTMNDQRILSA
jgi:hypothetical protein